MIAEQLTLARAYPSRVLERREQSANLARVRGHIGQVIAQFARERGLAPFHADELRRYVSERVPVAPSSPDRILRLLRREGTLDYMVVSRSQAMYRFTRVPS